MYIIYYGKISSHNTTVTAKSDTNASVPSEHKSQKIHFCFSDFYFREFQ